MSRTEEATRQRARRPVLRGLGAFMGQHARALKFATIGVSGVGVNLGFLYVLVNYTEFHYALAAPLAIEASVLSNYCGNRLWTWRDRRVGWDSLLHFHGVSLVSLVLQWSSLVGLVELAHIHYLTASLIGIALGSLWGFVANHHFTFAAPDSRVRRRLSRPLLYVGSLALQVLLAAFFVHPWDGFVFERSVENFVQAGETPYATIEAAPAYVYNKAYVPPYPEWYAYPPLSLLLFALTSLPHLWLGLGPDPVARVLLKLPIIAASLALPFLARRLAEAHRVAPARARTLERFLLFNPLLFVIGPMWGMTEPLLLAFLLGSLLTLERGRTVLSGVLFGLGALVKIFPLFLYPVLLAFLTLQPRPVRRLLQHAGAAAATWVLVSLPFFALNPQGFAQLVFLMHIERPSAGFSLFGPLQALVTFLGGPAAADRVGPSFSIMGLTGYFAVLIGACLHIRRARTGTRDLPYLLGITYLLFLLSNKVVNEQYLLILLVLVACAAFLATGSSERPLRRVAHAFSLAAASATLLQGLRFFRFFPRDVAPHVLGTTPPEFILRIRQGIGLNHEAMVGITSTVSVTFLLLAALPLFPLLGRHVRISLRQLAALVPAAPTPQPTHHPYRRLTVALLLALLVLPTAGLGLMAQAEHDPPPPPPPLGARVVGAYYYLWWENPSNDFRARYGNWQYATTTPRLGYYSSYAGEIAQAVHQMKAAGIDFALVPLQGYENAPLDALTALAYASEQEGFRFSPLFDVATVGRNEARHIPAETRPLPLDGQVVDAFNDYVNRYAARAYQSPNLLRWEGGRPLVFLEGLRWLGDPSDPDEQAHVARFVIQSTPASLLTLAVGNATWTNEPRLLAPPNFATAQAPDLLARYWDDATRRAHADAWTRILENLERRIPNAAIALAAQDLGALGFPTDRVAVTYDAWDAVRPGGTGAARSIGFQTLWPQYNAATVRPADPIVDADTPAGLALAWRWAALADQPWLLIHSWNEHQEGTAIEPTWEHGDRFLAATTRWSSHWRALPSTTLN